MALSTHSAAQQPETVISSEPNYKLFTGGQLGLSFGSVTNIELSPMLGFYVNRYFSFGIGASYQYYYDKRYYPAIDPIKLSIIGGRGFVRVHPLTSLFGHAEYEYLTYKANAVILPGVPDGQRVSSQNLLVGGGYMQMMSDRLGTYIMLLWNLNENFYTPYSNPVFRVGIEIALW